MRLASSSGRVCASPGPDLVTIDISAFRRHQARQPLHGYEILFGVRRRGAPRGLRADTIMGSGWARAGAGALSLVPPVAWESLNERNRSAAFELHAWTPLSPLLVRHTDTGDITYLRFAVEVALDWLREYSDTEAESEFAWYDMALGARAYRLGYILDATAREESFSDEVVEKLVKGAVVHGMALAEDERVAWHSNHGFYLAAGQLALGRRFPALAPLDRARDKALRRLETLMGSQFSPEGVHLEHSPGYHMAVLHSFNGLVEAGLLEGTELASRRQTIEAALAWFVTPNGCLATFGDTDRRRVAGATAGDFEHPGLRFVLSDGRDGAAPSERFRGFAQSGYFVARDWNADGNADRWYLAQMAAFHSRTHKHADDLSFVWFDRGVEILADPGRYGYLGRTAADSKLAREGFWYSDPGRVFVESTCAHNAVEIDGRNYERAGVRPYASALGHHGESHGVLYSECEARHFASIRHARVLLLDPGRWLLVFDWLQDGEGEAHRFEQRFQFAPSIDVLSTDGGGVAFALPSGESLHMVSLTEAEHLPLTRGRSEPRMLGWVAQGEGKLVPAWTGGYVRAGESACALATLFAFGADAPVPGECRVTPSGRGFTLRFALGARREELRIRRPARGEFTLSRRNG